MVKILRSLILCLLLCAFAFSTYAETGTATTDLMDEDLNLDELFEEDSEVQDLEGDEQAEKPEEPQKETVPPKDKVDLLEDVVGKSEFVFGGNFRFATGYSSGWTYMPWNPAVGEDTEMDDMVMMDMSSTLTLDFKLGPEFRVLQKYSLSFPKFETQVTEFFGDYSIRDQIFFRIGRQNLTWGTSRFYPFANLTARIPEDFGAIGYNDAINDADSYALKLDIPVAMGGIQGLIFTRNGFFEDPNAPSSEEIGYGGNFNLAQTWGDFTVGTFYHKAMNWRSFYSFSATVFDNIEIYQEGVVSYDIQNDDLQPLYDKSFVEIDQSYQYPVSLEDYSCNPILSDRMDFDLNFGGFVELFDKKLKLSAEYFYCGEETELDLKNSSYPLLWGHNLAGGFSCQVFRDKLKVYSQVKYNTNEKSGLILSGMTFDTAEYFTLNLAVPVIFGETSGGYYTDNTDRLDRPVSFILYGVISGKM